jgi:hypothetical protein
VDARRAHVRAAAAIRARGPAPTTRSGQGEPIAAIKRVYGGAAEVDLATGIDDNGTPVVARQRVSLAPNGSETAFSINYSRPLGDAVSFGLTVTARTDADNVGGAKDAGAMVRFRLSF